LILKALLIIPGRITVANVARGLYLQHSELAKRAWIVLFLAIAVFYFYGLGAIPFVGPDEPRYAEVAREMFARHDLITPTLGGLPWFEKPALLYWLMIAGYRVFGVSEYAARFGPAVCGLLTAVFVCWIGRRVEESEQRSDAGSEERPESARPGRRGLAAWSTLVFLSSGGAIVFSRAASCDIVVTMTVTAALACFFAWQNARESSPDSHRGSIGALAGFYFFVGASLLAKGLVGLLIPGGVVGFYFLFRREIPRRRLLLSLVWGLPLTAAVAATWYGPMIARHGWKFIDQFIIQHHFARFLTQKYHHPQPFYFYLPVLAAIALPWTIVLVSAFGGAIRRWNWRGNSTQDRLHVFALAWIVVPVVFFSFSESKLPAYILPVLPAVALLVGDRLTRFLRNDGGRLAMRLTGILTIAIAVLGVFYAVRTVGVPMRWSLAMGSLVIVAAAVAVFRPQLQAVSILLVAFATFGGFVMALSCGGAAVASRESARDLLRMADARGYGKTPVVQLFTIERTSEFYAAGRLTYGSDGEPVELEGVSQVVDAARSSGGDVLVLVPVEYVSKLTESRSLDVEVIGDNGRVALARAHMVDSPN
jgi:4-amino-4-deoxy-L-arabinose transferase-like glycosyltransferase